MLQSVNIDALKVVRAAPELSIIVPTFNERENVGPLIQLIEDALPDIDWEIVFVDDDSPDGTIDFLSQLARDDYRVRCILRIGRRGLASAVVEGALSTTASYVAVIDADMQHDERLLPQMLALLRGNQAELVIGSRYVERGSVGDWSPGRQMISRVASALSRLVTRADLTDPMSGFFMMRRETFSAVARHLSAEGYKIMLDIVTSAAAPLRIKELPYVFRNRQHGESKLDALVTLEYIILLLDKLVGHWVPVRFVLFSLIGALGVVIHMAVLGALLKLDIASFMWAQAAAAFVAMTFNFFVNNTLTYRDRQLKGAGPLTRGLLTFYAVCSVGAVANVGIANFLFTQDYRWWISGLSGILVGAVWNYAASSIFTWGRR